MSSVSKSLIQGMQEALEHVEGGAKSKARTTKVCVPKEVDVKAVRNSLKMTRAKFSSEFGFNQRTLEKWEQGSRHPDSATRAYLTVIAKEPKMVKKALKSSADRS